MIRSTARGSTVTASGLAPPYSTAGTTPLRRRRLATCLPVPSRRLIVSSCVCMGAPSNEQGRNRFLVVDAADGLAEERGHREDRQPARPLGVRHRNGVGDDDLFEGRGLDAVERGA